MKYKFISTILASILVLGMNVNAFALSNEKFSTSIGVDFAKNNIDTSTEAYMFDRHMQNIGFTNNLITDLKFEDFNAKYQGKKLLEGNVLMMAGLGSSTNILLNYKQMGGSYATGLTTGETRYTNADNVSAHMFGVDDNYWGETALAVFCGCETALGGPSSLASSVLKAGADVSIGFREVIQDSDADKWVTNFGRYLENYTIGEAFELTLQNTSFENPNTIRSVIAFSISPSRLNVFLKDYVSGTKAYSENDDTSGAIQVEENVPYSFDKGDLTAISEYISSNFDSSFDLNKFQITEITKAADLDGNIMSGAIILDYKIGDFVTENNYYIAIDEDKISRIYIKGNPSCDKEEPLPIVDISDEELKELALQEIHLEEYEQVRKQDVLKKFDTQPYYTVITVIEGTKEGMYAHSEAFEYRP